MALGWEVQEEDSTQMDWQVRLDLASSDLSSPSSAATGLGLIEWGEENWGMDEMVIECVRVCVCSYVSEHVSLGEEWERGYIIAEIISVMFLTWVQCCLPGIWQVSWQHCYMPGYYCMRETQKNKIKYRFKLPLNISLKSLGNSWVRENVSVILYL